MQKLFAHNHENNNDHKSGVARGEALHFPPSGSMSITCHVQNAIEKKLAKTITCMKILYFIVFNYCSIINLKESINFYKF